MTKEVKLLVNDTSVPIDYFVEAFIDHTVGGMIESLEGTGEIKDLVLSIEAAKVSIKLNNAEIPANAFVSKIIRNTVVGMISSLKGVSDTKRVKINLQR